MSGPVRTAVEHDLASGASVVTLRGELTPADVGPVCDAVRGCLTEWPMAVLVDLNRLELDPRVIPAAAEAMRADGCVAVEGLHGYGDAAAPAARAARGALRGLLPVYANRQQALVEAVRHVPEDRMHAHLPAEVTSPARARALAVEACRRWHLPHLADDAQVIVSELVSNAVQHAGTDAGVTLGCGDGWLYLQVRDRSRTPPRLRVDAGTRRPDAPRGRGLWLVGRLAARWGVSVGADGKAVWASMGLPVSRGAADGDRDPVATRW